MSVNLSLTWTLLILVANSSLSECSYAAFTSVSRCWAFAFSRSWMFSASACFTTLTPFTPLSPVSIHYEKITSLANAGFVLLLLYGKLVQYKKEPSDWSLEWMFKVFDMDYWEGPLRYMFRRNAFSKQRKSTKENSLLLSRISFSVHLYWRRPLFMNVLVLKLKIRCIVV